MSSIERRLRLLETANNVRGTSRNAFVIFNHNKASISIDAPAVTFERERRDDQTPDDFVTRVLDEARSFGGRVSRMTEEEFQIIAAQLEEQI